MLLLFIITVFVFTIPNVMYNIILKNFAPTHQKEKNILIPPILPKKHDSHTIIPIVKEHKLKLMWLQPYSFKTNKVRIFFIICHQLYVISKTVKGV